VDCPSWPELNLTELTQEQLARLAGRRYPFSGSFELTERCNLGCVHCYINQPAASRAARARELATSQVAGILDQIADAGCLFLLLTGGEALVRSDFQEIYLYAVRKGLLLTLFTNGTLLTPRLADFLAEWRPRLIEITLYGATQDTYERVTRVPGSYAACMRGIELALDRRLPLHLKTMVLRSSRHELDEMQALADRLGVKFRYDAMLWPRCDGGEEPYDERLSPHEIVALDLGDEERRLDWQRLHANAPDFVRRDFVYSCRAGFRSFHIDCAGRLSPCLSVRSPAFDLLRGSFRDGWENVLGTAIREARVQDTACRTCNAGPLCDQCPGWSQAVHGDNETPVAFVCQIGRLRAAQFDLSHSES
jgi:radical SAM protein with 4Fe4S-binding SPASM domain